MNKDTIMSSTIAKLDNKGWSVKDPWSIKELFSLLLLTTVLVPLFIEIQLLGLFEQLFQNSLYAGTLTGVVMGIVITSGVYFIALFPKKQGWVEVGFRSFPKKYWLYIIIWSIVLLAGSILILYIMSLFGGSVENSKTESMRSHISLFTVLIALLTAGVISPIYEEIFYRGFLYRWIRTRLGRNWALFLSTALFTAAHIPTYNTLAVNFFSGLIFALTYEKTKSIIPAMLVHGITNTIYVLLTVAG